MLIMMREDKKVKNMMRKDRKQATMLGETEGYREWEGEMGQADS